MSSDGAQTTSKWIAEQTLRQDFHRRGSSMHRATNIRLLPQVWTAHVYTDYNKLSQRSQRFSAAPLRTNERCSAFPIYSPTSPISHPIASLCNDYMHLTGASATPKLRYRVFGSEALPLDIGREGRVWVQNHKQKYTKPNDLLLETSELHHTETSNDSPVDSHSTSTRIHLRRSWFSK